MLRCVCAQGVAFMVDNCSYTARLGSRKWAPRFDYMLEQQACNYLDANKGINSAMYATLLVTSPHGLGERASERACMLHSCAPRKTA